MTTVLLIRHASCEHVGRRIAGRAPGVHLDARGTADARILADRLCTLPVAAVYSSPLERALETAGPVAAARQLPVRVAPGLHELDFGEWTGLDFEELERDPRWRAFNVHRADTQIPGGEWMRDAVGRGLGELRRFEEAHPDGIVAAVSHGDLIRGLLIHFLGMSLDDYWKVEVDPASVSIVRLRDGIGRVAAVNWTTTAPAGLVQTAQHMAS
jgi:broad specificity phosphatase PhoE